MINKTEFTKIAKRILSTKNGAWDSNIMHPEREWGIGLVIGIFIFCSIAIWSSQAYLSNKEIGVSEDYVADSEIVVYRESMVKSALEAYELRNIRHLQLLSSRHIPSSVVDVFVSSSSENTIVSEDNTSPGTTLVETEANNQELKISPISEEETPIENLSSE